MTMLLRIVGVGMDTDVEGFVESAKELHQSANALKNQKFICDRNNRLRIYVILLDQD
jgi:hypothetical protein